METETRRALFVYVCGEHKNILDTGTEAFRGRNTCCQILNCMGKATLAGCVYVGEVKNGK